MLKSICALVITLLVLTPLAAAEGGLEAMIDWTDWDRILREHVVEGGVDYDGIAADPGFAATVEAIATADLSGQGAQSVLAFHINAYNVLAVRGILDGSSPRTAFGKLRFFYRDKCVVAGQRLSLHAYEHQVILPLAEPRIHFAIVCASASCPELRNEAYVPARLGLQLDEAARRFVNDPSKNTFDPGAGRARVSKIFKWFEDDFEAAAGSVSSYLALFIADEATAEALRDGQLKIRHLSYDWSLNGTFTPRRQ